MHVFKSATCGNLLTSTSFNRVMARSHETYIRAILEQVKLVAIILHGQCDKGIQQYYIRNSLQDSRRGLSRDTLIVVIRV